MKFVFRRAVLGLVALPVVAALYVVGYALLGLLGAGMTATPAEAWANGLLIASVAVVVFVFSTQLNRVASRLAGEVE
jgi:hypothetical protein